MLAIEAHGEKTWLMQDMDLHVEDGGRIQTALRVVGPRREHIVPLPSRASATDVLVPQKKQAKQQHQQSWCSVSCRLRRVEDVRGRR